MAGARPSGSTSLSVIESFDRMQRHLSATWLFFLRGKNSCFLCFFLYACVDEKCKSCILIVRNRFMPASSSCPRRVFHVLFPAAWHTGAGDSPFAGACKSYGASVSKNHSSFLWLT